MFQPKALLFDLDGVLLDTEPLHGQAWTKTAASFKTKLNDNQLKLLQGRRRVDCANQVSEWINQSIDPLEVLKVHQPISQDLLKNAKPMPGAKNLVIWCHENKLPIALITSSSSISVKNKTSPHPWLKMFSTKVHGDDAELLAGKPHPDPYLLGAKRLQVNPEECWAIEDSLSGTKSALTAGCKVWILKNNSNKNLTSQLNINNPSNPIFVDYLNNIQENLIELS
tara:strand:- start:55935 stop:56609 length:675 start_codon:yes stop_codon:yes gene_type:complete